MQKLLIAIRSVGLTDALTQALSSHFDIHRCNTGTDACRLLNSLQPDALVLDLRLPDSDGFSALRSCHHKPPVILAVTDFNNYEVQQSAYDAGIHALVMIPCSARHIAESLKELSTKIPSPER